MALFILVHGTFVSSANWPSLRAALKNMAASLGIDARFEEVLWTGKNSIRARQNAATGVLHAVQSARTESTTEPIFVMGHSHGGSAMAYFIKQYPEMAKTLNGYVFLSTPFVAIRAREKFATTMATLLFVPLIACSYLDQKFLLPIAYWASQSVWSYVVGLLPVLVWVLLTLLAARAEALTSKTIQNQTVDLPSTLKYLFVRFVGDEAAAVLSSAQFISWLGSKATIIVGPPVRWLFSKGLIKGSIYGILIGLALSTIADMLFFNVIHYIGDNGFDGLIDVIGSSDSFYKRALFVLALVIGFCLSLVFIGSPIVALAVIFAQALTSWAFGWTDFLAGLAIEFAVEPIPFGGHKLFSLNWSNRSSKSNVHSWTYEDRVAIGVISVWVAANMKSIGLDSTSINEVMDTFLTTDGGYCKGYAG